jgi:hypothetical protein
MLLFRMGSIELLLLAALGCGGTQDRLPEHQRVSSRALGPENHPAQELSGLYYGREANGWASLLYFRPDSMAGVAYDPAGLVQLCDVVDSAGKVSFRMAPIGDSEIHFQGELSSSGRLIGETRTRTKGSSRRGEQSAIQLDRLQEALPFERTPRRDSSGVFSNVVYSDEGGDLNGAELVLVRVDIRWYGLFTEYEGSPQGPYTARLTHARADTLWVEREDSIESPIEVAWQGDSVIVLGERTLKRRASISELLSRPPRFRCQ